VGVHDEAAADPGVDTAHVVRAMDRLRRVTLCEVHVTPVSIRRATVAQSKGTRCKVGRTDDCLSEAPLGCSILEVICFYPIRRRSHAELMAERCAVPRPPWSSW
jgi:hypothetical protein